MDGHACRLPFDTDEPLFARGFEAGRLWTVLEAQPDAYLEQIVHVTNTEMVMRMGEALGRPVRSEELDEVWMTVVFGPSSVKSKELL
jgi:putative heme iron utilization protein